MAKRTSAIICGPHNNDTLRFFEERERFYRRQCLDCGHGLRVHLNAGPCKRCSCVSAREYHPRRPVEQPERGGS